jgi:hypothetical protein
MTWWTLSKPYVEALAAVIAFALSVGNTVWLIKKARKEKTEDTRRAAVEAELRRIVEAFVRGPTQILSIWQGTNDLLMDAAVLGLSRGVLRGFWDYGKLHLILATIDGDAAEERAKLLQKQFRAMEEAQLPKVLELVAQHGAESFEVPMELRAGARLAFRRGLVQWRVHEGGRVRISARS